MNVPFARRRGFTLIEVLVAVLIFALISAAAYASIGTLLTSREALHARAGSLQALQATMSRLERDLRQALAAPVRDGYGESLPLFAGDATHVELTRAGLANPLGQARARIERVQWALSGQALQRVRFAVLDRAVGTRPEVESMLGDIERMTFTYYDGGQWRTQWPRPEAAATRNELPRAVALELQSAEFGRLRRVVMLVEPALPEALP